MIPKSYAEKHYRSAKTRFFDSILDKFLKENVPQIGGPELRKFFIKKLMKLFEKYILTKDRIKPGQMLWVSVDKNTRADSKNVKYVPTVLTLLDQNEINDLVTGKSNGNPNLLFSKTIARICKEAYQQGGLLSMRDIALIYKRNSSGISQLRKKYELKNNEILPTPAVIQDMGSGITHKTMILKKILIEKKDMKQVRNETKHSQNAIDKYYKDYQRIALLLQDKKSVDYISKVTNIGKYTVQQHKEIYQEVNPK
jgi:hypothetical protein